MLSFAEHTYDPQVECKISIGILCMLKLTDNKIDIINKWSEVSRGYMTEWFQRALRVVDQNPRDFLYTYALTVSLSFFLIVL